MFYNFQMNHNLSEAMKTICSVKDENIVNHRIVTKLQEPRQSGE